MNDLQLQISKAEQRLKDIPQWAEKYGTKIKWVGAAAVCVAIAPIVLAGIGGLVGGIVFVSIGYAATQFAPVVARRIANAKQEMLISEANRHLQALKAEARRNPVETMQNVYREKETTLHTVGGKITKFATKVNKYGMKVADLKKQFPNEAATFDKIYSDMMLLLQRRRAKWEEARDKLKVFEQEIVRADAIWQMTQATAELREAAGDLEDNFLQRIRQETALDAVQESLAASMADLDQMMMEEIDLEPTKSKPALANNPSDVIDATVISTQHSAIRKE